MYVYVIICTSPPCHLLIDTPETLLIHASSKGPFNYPHPSLNICLFEHTDSQFIVPCSVTHTSRGKNKTVCRSLPLLVIRELEVQSLHQRWMGGEYSRFILVQRVFLIPSHSMSRAHPPAVSVLFSIFRSVQSINNSFSISS